MAPIPLTWLLWHFLTGWGPREPRQIILVYRILADKTRHDVFRSSTAKFRKHTSRQVKFFVGWQKNRLVCFTQKNLFWGFNLVSIYSRRKTGQDKGFYFFLGINSAVRTCRLPSFIMKSFTASKLQLHLLQFPWPENNTIAGKLALEFCNEKSYCFAYRVTEIRVTRQKELCTFLVLCAALKNRSESSREASKALMQVDMHVKSSISILLRSVYSQWTGVRVEGKHCLLLEITDAIKPFLIQFTVNF